MANWNPVTHPFIVRSHRQSSIAGNCGWVVTNVGEPIANYAEAKALADKPMGCGEISRYVDQALNGNTWNKNGKWRKCFERKRGNKVIENGPMLHSGCNGSLSD